MSRDTINLAAFRRRRPRLAATALNDLAPEAGECPCDDCAWQRARWAAIGDRRLNDRALVEWQPGRVRTGAWALAICLGLAVLALVGGLFG
jgi:hypothetical protein